MTENAADPPDEEALIAEMARLLEATHGKAEDSPEMKALDEYCALMIERRRAGLAS